MILVPLYGIAGILLVILWKLHHIHETVERIMENIYGRPNRSG